MWLDLDGACGTALPKRGEARRERRVVAGRCKECKVPGRLVDGVCEDCRREREFVRWFR